MEMQNLKRCPFCGGKAEITKYPSETYDIKCSNPNCNMVVMTPLTDTKERAIELWNKRLSPWHTGTPTEDGTFIVLWEDTEEQVKRYSKLHFNEYNNTWYDEETSDCNWVDEYRAKVIAWMKVEPYSEESK